MMESIPQLISLNGHRALITGAAAGIGRAVAMRFAEAGCDLELVDLNARGLELLQNRLRAFGTQVNLHKVDVADKQDRDRLWDALHAGLPDILVNNAGIYPFKRFLEINEGFYIKVMLVNFDSVFWMCHQMIRRRAKLGGVIINVASIEAILPFKKDLAHYSTSKAGVIALTRSLAREHGKDGFRVNVVVPGGIVTQGTKNAAKRVFKQVGLLKTAYDFRQRLPMGRLGDPDEVARIALVLATDLSSYVHGATIPVDGGFLSS